MTSSSPRPVSELDEGLKSALAGFHRLRWAALGVAVAVLVAVVAGLALWVASLRAELEASCAFYRPVTTVPVQPVPPAKRPSELGVQLVVGARDAYAGQHCGKLPPAQPSLQFWAGHYHIPVP